MSDSRFSDHAEPLPLSMVWFQRCFMATLTCNLASMVVTLPLMDRIMAENQEMFDALGWSTLSFFSQIVGTFLFMLLMWFMVVRLRSNFAKWILTFLLFSGPVGRVLTPILVSAPIVDYGSMVNGIGLVNMACGVAAGLCLHLPVSRAWFAAGRQTARV